MTEAPDIRQVLVHPAVWPHLELWLATRGLVLGRVPVEDDLPTYAMALAAPGDAEQVLAAGIRDAARTAAARQTTGQADTDLPARLRAVLTERYTELGNPFSAMRIQFQGPDGWPATKPVGADLVAETLRELLAASAVGQPAEAQATDEARPPESRWCAVRKGGNDWIGWMNRYLGPEHAAEALADRRKHYPDDEFQIVREKTTWTVEDER